MEARSPSFPVMGYLGTDFLSHFKTTIDPKNRIANQRIGSLVGQDLVDQLKTELEKLGG